jgi:hypothetical protein
MVLYDIARAEADRVVTNRLPGENLEAATAIIRVICALHQRRRMEAVEFTARRRDVHHQDHLDILATLSGHEILSRSVQIPKMMENMFRTARDVGRDPHERKSSPREMIEHCWTKAAIQEVRDRFVVQP